MSKDKMKLSDGGKIKLSSKTFDFGAEREMSNGNRIDLHSHNGGEVYLVIATNLQNKEQGPVKTQHAYSKEAMFSIIVLFQALEQTRAAKQKTPETIDVTDQSKEQSDG